MRRENYIPLIDVSLILAYKSSDIISWPMLTGREFSFKNKCKSYICIKMYHKLDHVNHEENMPSKYIP